MDTWKIVLCWLWEQMTCSIHWSDSDSCIQYLPEQNVYIPAGYRLSPLTPMGDTLWLGVSGLPSYRYSWPNCFLDRGVWWKDVIIPFKWQIKKPYLIKKNGSGSSHFSLVLGCLYTLRRLSHSPLCACRTSDLASIDPMQWGSTSLGLAENSLQEKPSGGISVKSKWGVSDLIAQGQKAEGLVTEKLELLGWDPDKRTLRQRR